jgi:polar amino acid transport system substrate-binding protein
MLAKKRGDIVIEWPHGAWPDIRGLGLEDQVVDTGVRISTMPFHLLIRKNSPYTARLNDFNDTIKRMRADGTIESILAYYGLITAGDKAAP